MIQYSVCTGWKVERVIISIGSGIDTAHRRDQSDRQDEQMGKHGHNYPPNTIKLPLTRLFLVVCKSNFTCRQPARQARRQGRAVRKFISFLNYVKNQSQKQESSMAMMVACLMSVFLWVMVDGVRAARRRQGSRLQMPPPQAMCVGVSFVSLLFPSVPFPPAISIQPLQRDASKSTSTAWPTVTTYILL